ncbi:ATP-binding protein [Myxacorys almedinensis]|uniref:histidine kinase n=1 Tax=Myxacorys almedinensis A TaxID=2690445 RepID=A0A8J7Z819_9CYAN|nr:ATP-binding protein [Myxacorys almedinensis]NDJ17205.1 PAS domain S-box protein [Myxacorys almedinensis A]
MTSEFLAGNELHTQIQYRLIEQLSESERRYRELVENLREIVFKCDRAGNFTLLNKAWSATLGYSSTECLDRSLDDFLHAEDREIWLELLPQLLDKQVVANQELRFHHQTAEIVWLELSARSAEQGEISGSLTNVSDRKRAQAALKEANEALQLRIQQLRVENLERKQTEATLLDSQEKLKQQAEQLEVTLKELKQTQTQLVHAEKMSSLGQLVAGIAHEINNPVNFIHGNLSHAEEYIQELAYVIHLYQVHYPTPTEIQVELERIDLAFLLEDLPKLMTSMNVGAERIREIVLSLRNFSRLDEAEIKPVNIHDGIDSTLMILQNRLKGTESNAVIQIIKEYADLPLVECYAGPLNQVFMNLISNAIDAVISRCIQEAEACPQNSKSTFTPTIRIRTEPVAEEHIAIHIIDNGMGMSEETQKQIFDPFFTTKPVGKGTGLGLSISYQMIVERHGGVLKCLSTLNKGTEFLIQIPIALYH